MIIKALIIKTTTTTTIIIIIITIKYLASDSEISYTLCNLIFFTFAFTFSGFLESFKFIALRESVEFSDFSEFFEFLEFFVDLTFFVSIFFCDKLEFSIAKTSFRFLSVISKLLENSFVVRNPLVFIVLIFVLTFVLIFVINMDENVDFRWDRIDLHRSIVLAILGHIGKGRERERGRGE